MTVRQLLGECFALFCALMLGLAAGAVWLLPVVFLRHSLPWLALPAGWLLALAIRQWVHGRRWISAVLACVATIVACVYLRMLVTAMDISAMTGYGLVAALRTAGPSMLWDLARIGLRASDLAWFAAGAALAAITAWRGGARQARVSRPAP